MPRLLPISCLCCLCFACGTDDRGRDVTDASSVDVLDAPGLVVADLVINEVSAVEGDYIELMNVGAAPIDIGGYRLVDQLDGVPRPDEAVVFDANAVLAPGEILLIQGGLGADARAGEQTACGPGVPPRCYYAAWGLSDVTGDALYVSSPQGDTVLEFEYAAGAVNAGAWGRLPDGTGDFANTALSPGQPNTPYVAP